MPSQADDLITTDIDVAVARLRAGGLVAIPTETVYGLAADAEQPAAVSRIFAVKGRPADHPLIVHVTGVDALDGWVVHPSEAALTLGAMCWPGPLTMLLPRGPRVGDWVTGGRVTVGVRAPAHPAAQEMLARFGGAVAAPSANRFGRVSPTDARHVLDDLGDLLEPGRDAIFDGGPCAVGVESTIVDLTASPPQVLRSGAIGADEVARLLAVTLAAPSGPSRTSGMLASHYAPECQVVLADSRDDADRIAAAARRSGRAVDVLDRAGDPVTAAQRLYADLRAADARRLDALVVVLPPALGLGIAVRDRLTKAAAAGGRPPSSRAR